MTVVEEIKLRIRLSITVKQIYI